MDDLSGWLLPLLVVGVLAVGWLLSRKSRPQQTESEQDWQSTHLHVPSTIDSRNDSRPAPMGVEAQAADVADQALRDAQESARREVADREAAERAAAARAAAQAAADREAAERAAASRQRAEHEARLEADRLAERLAEAARQRVIDDETARERREQEEAARRELARQEAERQAEAARALEAELQAEFERLQAGQRAADDELAALQEAARLEAEAAQVSRAEAERAEASRVEAERQAAETAARVAAEAEAEAAAALAAAASVPPFPWLPSPARSASETLVMVVDDSKVVRVKTSRLLASHQFRVALAEDGQAALAVIAQEAPQVLITDVEMPGMDGLSLTRAVRADVRTASLPVVMITSADDRLKDEAAAAGVTVLMGKPYTDHELVGHVARLAGVTLAA